MEISKQEFDLVKEILSHLRFCRDCQRNLCLAGLLPDLKQVERPGGLSITYPMVKSGSGNWNVKVKEDK